MGNGDGGIEKGVRKVKQDEELHHFFFSFQNKILFSIKHYHWLEWKLLHFNIFYFESSGHLLI